MKKIEQFSVFEITLEGAKDTGLVLYCAMFKQENTSVTVPAFRAGDGAYWVRFMPQKLGKWQYAVTLDDQKWTGEFECVANTCGVHGVVQADGNHLRYEDGERFISFGTTCYAWTHQEENLQLQTLKTLEAAPFNKIRMCVFPKSMPYNQNDPAYYPFHRDEDGKWDVQNPDERYWLNLEERLEGLAKLGIEADLILFHPYDRWGFSEMTQEADCLYLEYAMARLAAFHNIWWSLANEYDLLVSKDYPDWEVFGELISARDPYHHLLGNHNCLPLYPSRDWMTHASVQSADINHIPAWQREYDAPVCIDECGYEGDIEYHWGNLSAFEMVHRFWWTMIRGGYCTHGETFHQEDEVLWWAKGGKLHGESPARIHFLRELMEGIPEIMEPAKGEARFDPNNKEDTGLPNGFARGLTRLTQETRDRLIAELVGMMLVSDSYQLTYFGHSCPSFAHLPLPENGQYRVEVLDSWEMTRTIIAENAHGMTHVVLPAKEGMAILVTRLEGASLV